MKNENRHESEKYFHDKKFINKRRRDHYAYGFNRNIFLDMMERIGNVEDKKVLEIGCGEGWFAKNLASKGAAVWTFDISQEAVAMASARLKELNFKYRVNVEQMAAEKLTYESAKFDLVVGIAVLHHLDMTTALEEIKRVLKPGGRVFFMEPLGHNPLVNLYRAVTPGRRSKDEVPIKYENFTEFSKIFRRFEHDEFYLTAIFALGLHFLHMNNLMLKARDMLFKLDMKILKYLPALRKYCWYSILMMEK